MHHHRGFLSSRSVTGGAWLLFLPIAVVTVAVSSCSRLEYAPTADGGVTGSSGDDGSTSQGGSQSGGSQGGSQSGGSQGGSQSGGSQGGSQSGGSQGGSQSGGSTAGPPDMVVSADASVTVTKMACAASTTAYPMATGYQISSANQSAAQAAVTALTETQQANLMRGTASGCGGTLNYSDIFESGGSSGQGKNSEGAIREMFFRDGPRGVCLVPYSTVTKANNQFPVGDYSTTFPAGSARGATFDMALEQEVGAAIGDEMVAAGSTMLLAPVINILRHPSWGRSQETYGEDSFELGRMGTAFVLGAQTYIPACVKHFAAYNIEHGRETGNVSVLDEQTAYESYGRHFEMVIQDGGVACVMAAYNQIQIAGGTTANCTSNPDLLTQMLRTTFGFKGFVLSDWWAMPGGQNCPNPDTEKQNAATAVKAGLDLELPWSMNYSQIEADVASGSLGTSDVLTSSTRVATQQYRFNVATPGAKGLMASTTSFNNGTYSITGNTAHVQLAYQAAIESMVLLKNSNATLPIASTVKTVAVIGANVPYTLSSSADVQTGTVHFATDVRTGDLGSSRTYTDPATSTSPFAGIKTAGTAKGVTVVSGTDATPTADFYVVVAGLTPEDEGEEYTSSDGSGGDRSNGSGVANFNLDGKSSSPTQNALIQAVAAKGKPMVVILEGGSVIDMPWLSTVPAVVMAWYPGQDGGHAMGDLLFGNANFSGKLPVTWPAAEADEPAFVGSGGSTTMDYYVGYKYFDKNAKTPLFPFGAGLSYTTFTYSNLVVPCSTVTKDSIVNVQALVTNSGTVDGDEVSFLFVSYPNTAQRRPAKELKGFHRTHIKAGQSVLINIPLRVQDLKYWDTTTHSWAWESGTVQVMVGGSSTSLTLKDTFTLN
jgi:beta-glucosidase